MLVHSVRMQLELSTDPAVPTRREPGGEVDIASAVFAALSVAPIGVAVLDRDLRNVHVNAWLARRTGLAPDELVGRTPAEVFPGYA